VEPKQQQGRLNTILNIDFTKEAIYLGSTFHIHRRISHVCSDLMLG